MRLQISTLPLLALLICTSGGPLFLAPSTVQAEEGSGTQDEGRGESYWRQRQAMLQNAVADAEIRAEKARNAYTLMMNNDYPKGDRRAEVREERDTSELALTEARQDLDAFPEEARQAGVPPGWLRE